MSEQMDGLLQAMQELTTTVKEHKPDPATIDMDAITAEFAKMNDQLTALQVAQAPVFRRGETEDVAPDGQSRGNGVIKDGKFAGLNAFDLSILACSLKGGKKQMSPELVKAMDSTTDGSGDDFVPTLMGSEIWQQVYLKSKIAQALGPMVQMPSNPYHVPIWSTFTWQKGTENTAATASNPTTAQSIMTATELLAEVDWSYTLDEDSIVPMLPNLRAELIRGAAEELDSFLLNADATNAGTGNINLDDADPADTKPYLSDGQDGLRHYWLVDDTAQGASAAGAALSDSMILSALARMGKYAVDPEDCFMTCDVTTYFKGLMGLDGVQTLDKYGGKAVLLVGELASYRGVPILVSASAPLTEADGKVSTTAGNNIYGQLSIVNKRMWKVGSFRGLTVEMDKDIQKRQTIMVASFRAGIASYDLTSNHGAGIYYILVT